MVKISRRTFVTTMSVAGGTVALGNLVPPWFGQASKPEAVSLGAADFTALTGFALGTARALGCAYASMGINRRRDGAISPRGGVAAIESERLTFDVRVVQSGGWGHAVRSTPTTDEIARASAAPATIPLAARKDRWGAPPDPIRRPLDEQLASLVAAGNRSARTFAAEETFFVSSKGGFDHSTKLRVA